MDCQECWRELDERIFGPGGDRLSPDLSAVQSHLDECPACREDLAGMLQIGQWASEIDELAQKTPAEVLERDRRRILAEIGERTAPRAKGLGLLGSACVLAAAAVVAIGLGVWAMMQRGGSEIEPALASPKVADKATPEPRPKPKAESVPATLAGLSAEFKKLMASDGGVDRPYIERLQDAIARGNLDKQQRLEAYRLLVEACEQAGEVECARKAFAGQLDLIEILKGRPAAVYAIVCKADGLFSGKQDFLGGLAYYDMLLSRYPDDPVYVPYALFMVGEYYRRTDEPDRAVKEYARLVEKHPKSGWAYEGDKMIATLLYNMGERERAYETLRASIEKYPKWADFCHFHLGMLKYGAGDYADAVKEFRLVMAKYPKSPQVGKCRYMLAKMTEKMTRGLLDDEELKRID